MATYVLATAALRACASFAPVAQKLDDQIVELKEWDAVRVPPIT